MVKGGHGTSKSVCVSTEKTLVLRHLPVRWPADGALDVPPEGPDCQRLLLNWGKARPRCLDKSRSRMQGPQLSSLAQYYSLGSGRRRKKARRLWKLGFTGNKPGVRSFLLRNRKRQGLGVRNVWIAEQPDLGKGICSSELLQRRKCGTLWRNAVPSREQV